MTETRRILALWKKAKDCGKKSVLATVVRVEGSSYRRPGAKMLILEDGEIAGCVSGGCLERDLIQKALALKGQASLLRYDTRSDSDDTQAEQFVKTIGLGCEGVIEILLNPSPEVQLESMLAALESGKGRELSLELPDGSRFLDKIEPARKLIIFGAGHDAVPLARLASLAGWSVTVVDCRSSFPTPRRYFDSVDFFIQSSPDRVFEKLDADGETCVVTMTHNYEHDCLILAQVLERATPAYIGMLGPKSRSEKLLATLNPRHVERGRPRLYYPAGLDIGGDSPEAIALSILAEIQSVLAGRSGGSLKERSGPIH